MNEKIAMVTNVLDYVGPPAVKALLEDGYRVMAQDPAFQDTHKQENYSDCACHEILIQML